MLPQNVVGVLSLLTAPSPPVGDVQAAEYGGLYESYIQSYDRCRADRVACIRALGLSAVETAGNVGALGVGVAETLYSWVPDAVDVAEVVEAVGVAAEHAAGVASEVVERGANYVRNKRRREARKKGNRSVSEGSVPARTVVEVDEEQEARKTLALRRVAENKVAAKMAELRLVSLADVDKTNALAKLELARIQERINTATAKSQASYKKCDSPLDSVGSAGSAGEFAWKQEIRKRGVIVAERDSLAEQLDRAMPFISEEGRRVLAAMPTPYIPTDAEIEAMDADISPHPSLEDMEAEANAYFSRADAFFEH